MAGQTLFVKQTIKQFGKFRSEMDMKVLRIRFSIGLLPESILLQNFRRIFQRSPDLELQKSSDGFPSITVMQPYFHRPKWSKLTTNFSMDRNVVRLSGFLKGTFSKFSEDGRQKSDETIKNRQTVEGERVVGIFQWMNVQNATHFTMKFALKFRRNLIWGTQSLVREREKSSAFHWKVFKKQDLEVLTYFVVDKFRSL